MTTPEPRSSMPAMAERVSRNGAIRLTRTTSSNATGSVSASRGSGVCPSAEALLTSTSMRPKRSSVREISRSRSAGSATSAGTASTSAPSWRPSAATASRRASLRAQRASAAPSRAKARAIARPSPLEAPVTRAILPCSWLMHTSFGRELDFHIGLRTGSRLGLSADPGSAQLRPKPLVDETLPDCEDSRRSSVRNTQLLEHAADVRLDGLLRYPQAACDLLVGEPFHHQLKHLSLARCQRLHLRAGRL